MIDEIEQLEERIVLHVSMPNQEHICPLWFESSEGTDYRTQKVKHQISTHNCGRRHTSANYLRQYGAHVEIVVMDMNPSFKAAVKKALNRPVIVADRFHYCRYIHWAVDEVRRKVQKKWHSYDRKKMKRMRHVLHKDSSKLTDEDRWYLER